MLAIITRSMVVAVGRSTVQFHPEEDEAGKPVPKEVDYVTFKRLERAGAAILPGHDGGEAPEVIEQPKTFTKPEEPISGMTKAELIAYADLNGIAVDKAAKVDVIRAAVQAAVKAG